MWHDARFSCSKVADKAWQYRVAGVDDQLFGEAARSVFATGGQQCPSSFHCKKRIEGIHLLCRVLLCCVMLYPISSRLPARAGAKCPKKRIAIEGGPWRAYRKVVSRGLQHVAYTHIMHEHVRVFVHAQRKQVFHYRTFVFCSAS